MRRIVAAEKARVDDDAAHHAARAEAHDREVVSGRPLAAALPAVHPLATVGVLVLLPHRRVRLEQIFLLREIVVRRVEHGAAEALRREIERVAKIGHRRIPPPPGSPVWRPSVPPFWPAEFVCFPAAVNGGPK